MNDYKIKNFEIILTEDSESYFNCKLNETIKMQIALWSFYEFMSKTDKELEKHGMLFTEWEDFTRELIELEYDFSVGLNQYLQQFDNDEIEEFMMYINDKD
jgi:hypothetical protein